MAYIVITGCPQDAMPTIELTDRFCQTAKPITGRQSEFFDTITTGLSLVASESGARTFFVHYTRPLDGRRARMKLGRYPELKLARARERAREARGNVQEGGDPASDKRAALAALTVADMVDNYVARHASTRRSGDEIARRLRKNVSGVIGAVKLGDLHRRDLTRAIDAVKDRGAGVEANRTFEDLRAMVRWARGRGDLDENLVEGMKRPTETAVRDRVLDAAEIATMWAGLANADMREGTRNVLRLCLATAQRVGEVAGLHVREIDRNRQIWTIPSTRTKNGQEHAVPLSDFALAIIDAQLVAGDALARRKDRDPSGFVFPGPGDRGAMTAAAVAKAVKREEVTKRGTTTNMGVAPWTPHDLRRSASTGMEEIGVSPFVVGHVLNHVSATRATVTSRVYARYSYEAEKRDALDRWASRLAGILAPAPAKVVSIGRRGASR